MAKQVIVVVHGVGVKQAGVSSDLLAAALQDDDGKSDKTRCRRTPATILCCLNPNVRLVGQSEHVSGARAALPFL